MNLDAALTLLSQTPDAPLDVAELALELARDEYADLDIDAYLSELTGMAHEAKQYIRGGLEAQVTGFCRYLFHEMGFRGNSQDYYDPRNSYLNQVLERRTGIPISLSAVAMAIGSRAGLNVVGLGLPGHFAVKVVGEEGEVIFDPFHGGRLLTPESCEQLVEQVTGAPFQATAENLKAVQLGPMVHRMLSNLKAVYLRTEDFSRAIRIIERLRQLDPGDPTQERDLGVSLLQAGQTGKAVDYLSAYLANVPMASDAESVQQLVERATKELAKWN
jgi:regulator of sirC expression with transglutaminase-like and TPR domain